MNTDKSLFLSSIRWICSLLVLVGHSHLLGGGRGRIFVFLSSHSHAAVMVFFVLSGYVIASAVDTKRSTNYSLKKYYIDRISRIYSVLIPALLLTIVFDCIGVQLFPQWYLDPKLLPQDYYFIRLFINIFSLQGIWGYRVQFGSNPALWSIGYEFCYYLLFGLVVWRPKYWLLFVLSIMMVVGPKVALYGIIWLLGVLAYELQKRKDVKTSFWISLIVLLIANYCLQYKPLIRSEFANDFIFSLAVMAFVMSKPAFPSNQYFRNFNREMADFSYSSYAYHYPIMFMAYAFIPRTEIASWVCVGISLLIARLLYVITEGKRNILKSLLLKHF